MKNILKTFQFSLSCIRFYSNPKTAMVPIYEIPFAFFFPQASTMAHMQLEVEKQMKKKSPIAEMVNNISSFFVLLRVGTNRKKKNISTEKINTFNFLIWLFPQVGEGVQQIFFFFSKTGFYSFFQFLISFIKINW